MGARRPGRLPDAGPGVITVVVLGGGLILLGVSAVLFGADTRDVGWSLTGPVHHPATAGRSDQAGQVPDAGLDGRYRGDGVGGIGGLVSEPRVIPPSGDLR